jgi:hypothetical protein
MFGEGSGYTGQETVHSPELRRVDRRRTTDAGEEERRGLQVGPDGGHPCCTKERQKSIRRAERQMNPTQRNGKGQSRHDAGKTAQRGADHEFRTSPARSKSCRGTDTARGRSRSVRTGYSHVRRFDCRLGSPFARSPNFSFSTEPGARGKAPAPSCLQFTCRSLQASIVFLHRNVNGGHPCASRTKVRRGSSSRSDAAAIGPLNLSRQATQRIYWSTNKDGEFNPQFGLALYQHKIYPSARPRRRFLNRSSQRLQSTHAAESFF